MKTLHLHLTRQMLNTLALTVVVFTFVLLLGNVLQEILALLVNRQASIGLVARAIGLLIPWVLTFALPWGMLTAALLVFGRFSADNELTAARASGISLMALTTPVLLLSGAMSIVCGLFNLQIAPECRIAYKNLVQQIGVNQPVEMLTENRFIDDFPGFVVYVGKVSGEHLSDVLIYTLDSEGKIESRVQAEEALVKSDPVGKHIRLSLWRARRLSRTEGNGSFKVLPLNLDTSAGPPKQAEPKLSEMTFRQLLAKIRELERMKIDPELRTDPTLRIDTTPALVQLQRQLAVSFAPIGFTLIGIPLGIRAHRRETSAGVAMALILVLIYYSFLILAQAMETRTGAAPLLLWVPDFLFQFVGGALLWRANRGV